LDEVIKVTSRRVNALEHVVIPRIEGYINFIKKVLDEADREDFFRLKKLTDKKKKLKEIAVREAELAKTSGKHAGGEEEESVDTIEAEAEKSAIEAVLGEEGSEDIIF